MDDAPRFGGRVEPVRVEAHQAEAGSAAGKGVGKQAAMLAYIAALYCLRKGGHGRVIDALAINWMVNQAIVMTNSGYPDLPMFIAVDFMTGLYLVSWVGGAAAKRAAWVFIPMMSLNAAVAIVQIPAWHYASLFALAWIQLALVGAMEDGIRKALDTAVRGIRHPVSSALYYLRGHK